MKLHYFDQLLQLNRTGAVTCRNCKTSLQMVPPLVTCRTSDVTVKLPFGTTLKKVKSLHRGDAVEMVHSTATPDAVWVQISTPTEKVKKWF